MTRCAIYSRVSTDEQTTENQLMVLREIAERKGMTVVAEFNDEGISGAKGRDKRTGFDNIIKGAVKKDFDTILVWSVDRLGRSLQHLVSFLDEIHSVGCDLYIHQSGIDTSSISGKMMFQMCGVFAEFERGIIRERVLAGQKRAKSQGKHIGRPSNLNEGLIHSIKYMKEQGVGIRKIAKDLSVGVGTVYKVLEAA
ncbi:recombinase family protein [Candidatus Puniceispirillum marinum]|uniref:recombinase family protein n=1 Tax=Candidatus Puniceispirillum marinum TaxID=767892 RepID=UPI0005A4B000|nr:recombinase family protein [Candidatus Puniceispirillum marinum]